MYFLFSLHLNSQKIKFFVQEIIFIAAEHSKDALLQSKKLFLVKFYAMMA
jgi:hypothetical protein